MVTEKEIACVDHGAASQYLWHFDKLVLIPVFKKLVHCVWKLKSPYNHNEELDGIQLTSTVGYLDQKPEKLILN